MTRKLILTPTDQAYLYGYQEAENQISKQYSDTPTDITHFFLSAITMAGVDHIYTMLPFEETKTSLIKKLAKKSLIKDWANYLMEIEEHYKKYTPTKISKKANKDIFTIKHTSLQLLFAMKSNSAVILISDLKKLILSSNIRPELKIPFDFLLSAIETQNAQLPIVKYDIPKKDIKKLLEIINSKDFNTYKEAQSEIERNKNLSTKVIRTIEKAGKDLYRKNNKFLTLKETVIKAVPLTSQVIELYFGKLPGLIAEYSSKIILDYMGINNTIPLYTADSISHLLNYYKFSDSNKNKGSS